MIITPNISPIMTVQGWRHLPSIGNLTVISISQYLNISILVPPWPECWCWLDWLAPACHASLSPALSWPGEGGSKYSISPLYYLQPLQTLPGQDWSKPWCPRYNTSVNTSLYVVITTTNRDLPVKAVISALLILTLRSSPTITKLFMALSLDLFCKTAGCTTGQ